MALARDQLAQRHANQRGLQHPGIDATQVGKAQSHHAVDVPLERHVEQLLELLLREVRVHHHRQPVIAGGEGEVLRRGGAGQPMVPGVVDVAGTGGRIDADGDTERRVSPVLNVPAQARRAEQRLPVIRDVLGLAREAEQSLLEGGVVDHDEAHTVGVIGRRGPPRRVEHARAQVSRDRASLERPERASREDGLAHVGRGRQAEIG